MGEKQTPNQIPKLPLRNIEDAVLAAELMLNPEEIRATQARFDEAGKVTRECLDWAITI